MKKVQLVSQKQSTTCSKIYIEWQDAPLACSSRGWIISVRSKVSQRAECENLANSMQVTELKSMNSLMWQLKELVLYS